MSRGFGAKQREILNLIDGNISQNELMWKLLNRSSTPNTDITKTFSNTVYRALEALSRSGKIRKETFQVSTIEEFVTVAPYLTKSYEAKKLREDLLPELIPFLKSEIPVFTKKNTERHLIEKLKTNKPELWEELKIDWTVLREKILRRISSISGETRDLWLGLVVKGDEMYKDPLLTHEKSFSIVLQQLRNKSLTTEQDLLLDTRQIYQKTFQEAEAKRADMKSQLYAAFNLQGSKATVTDSFKSHLYKEKKTILVNLPYHKEPTSRTGWIPLSPPQYSPHLERLIDRNMLKNLQRLHLT